MIRIIANTTTPSAVEMTEMIGKTFTEYEGNTRGNYQVRNHTGNTWWFLEKDVERVKYQTEDDKFRELLLWSV